MPRKRNNPVLLTVEDRDTLEGLIAHGRAPARELSHARILLKALTRLQTRPTGQT